MFRGRDWVQLNDGDQLCFLTYEADAVGLRFNVTVTLPVASSTDEGAATPEVAVVRAKPGPTTRAVSSLTPSGDVWAR